MRSQRLSDVWLFLPLKQIVIAAVMTAAAVLCWLARERMSGIVVGGAIFFAVGTVLLIPVLAREYARELRLARTGRLAVGTVVGTEPLFGDSDDRHRVTGYIWTWVLDGVTHTRAAATSAEPGHTFDVAVNHDGPTAPVALDDLEPRFAALARQRMPAAASSAIAGPRLHVSALEHWRVVTGRRPKPLYLTAGVIAVLALGVLTGTGANFGACALIGVAALAVWLRSAFNGLVLSGLLRRGVLVEGTVLGFVVPSGLRAGTSGTLRVGYGRALELTQASLAPVEIGTPVAVVVDPRDVRRARALVRHDGDPQVSGAGLHHEPLQQWLLPWASMAGACALLAFAAWTYRTIAG